MIARQTLRAFRASSQARHKPQVDLSFEAFQGDVCGPF